MVWHFQGRIESETWSGLRKYYDIVEQEVQLEKDISLVASNGGIGGGGGMPSQFTNGGTEDTVKKARKKRDRSEGKSNPNSVESAGDTQMTGTIANPEVTNSFFLHTFFMSYFLYSYE